MVGQKKFAILEWAILLGLTVSAIAATEMIGLNQLWEDGVVYTVVLFASILTTLRPAWGRRSFWKSFVLIFTGHILVLLAVLHELPPRRFGIPKLLLLPIGVIEGLFLLGFLWKKMKVAKTSDQRF